MRLLVVVLGVIVAFTGPCSGGSGITNKLSKELSKLLEYFQWGKWAMKGTPNTMNDEPHSIAGYNTTKTAISVPSQRIQNITEMVTLNNYSIREYTVTTDDGYILRLFRINGAKQRLEDGKRAVVFLMHGLLDSADSWVLLGPEHALAYLLAERGYDVWLGNARGNRYSDRHRTLSTADRAYWRFSWHEIGAIDLPKMIDFVLENTKVDALYYAGHSQGTTSFYVMNSERPEYNKKIKAMFSLAPIAFMSHMKSPLIQFVSPAASMLSALMLSLHVQPSSSEFINGLTATICQWVTFRCDSPLSLIVGSNYGYIQEEMLPIMFAHIPSGASTMQLAHYGQLVQSGKFRNYDHGAVKNLLKYGALSPPDYRLGNVTAPVVLYYSDNDWLSHPIDVKRLYSSLRNARMHFVNKFNHFDYMYAHVARERVYDNIIQQIETFEKYFNLQERKLSQNAKNK